MRPGSHQDGGAKKGAGSVSGEQDGAKDQRNSLTKSQKGGQWAEQKWARLTVGLV